MWFIPSLTLPILEIEVHGLNYLNCIFNGAIFYAAAVIRELSKTDICDFIIQVLAFFEWDISPLLGSIFIFPFRNRYTARWLKRATRCKRCNEAFFCILQCGLFDSRQYLCLSARRNCPSWNPSSTFQ